MLSKRAHNFDVDLDYLNTYSVNRALRDPYDAESNPNLSDAVAAHDLKMPEAEGVLRIHVVEAKNLMKKDISVLGKGKSDPYAIVTVGAQQLKTQTIDNNVNPKWDYWCELTTPSPMSIVPRSR